MRVRAWARLVIRRALTGGRWSVGWIQLSWRYSILGTLLGELRQVRGKLAVPITGATDTEGMSLVEDLMKVLWDGQSSRHGNLQVTRDETDSEAVEAVHIAALLVQLFTTGAVTRR